MSTTVSITRAEFSDASQGRSIPVEDLKSMRRLNHIDVENADLNKDGKIFGTLEASALFDELDKHDRFDKNPNRLILESPRRLPLLGIKIPFFGPKTTKVGNAVEALAGNTAPELVDSVSEDPFAQFWVLTEGPWRGERVYTREKRSALSLDAEKAKPYFNDAELEGLRAGDGTQVIANFWHADRFWVALFPRDAVKELYVQQENFDSIFPAAHGQIRLDMHIGKPVKLVPQVPAEGVDPVFLESIVYSAEAAGIAGQGYSAIKGLGKHYMIAHRLLSCNDVAEEALTKNLDVLQFRIRFPDTIDAQEAKNAYLRAVVAHATEVGMNEVYHTISKNCILAVLRPLDELMGYDRSSISWDFHPSTISDSLDDRGLLDATKTPSLIEEFGSQR